MGPFITIWSRTANVPGICLFFWLQQRKGANVLSVVILELEYNKFQADIVLEVYKLAILS